jgi:hypothetical protein
MREEYNNNNNRTRERYRKVFKEKVINPSHARVSSKEGSIRNI